MRPLSAAETRLFRLFLGTEIRHHWDAHYEMKSRMALELASLAKSDAKQCETIAGAYDILLARGGVRFSVWVARRRAFWPDPQWPLRLEP